MSLPKIALFSTINSPLLGYQIMSLKSQGVLISAVILDSKSMSESNLSIHNERTNSRFIGITPFELESYKLPFYFVLNHNSKQTIDLIRYLDIDLVVNAGTPRILGHDILSAPSIGILNCHPGILPFFRGCTCVEWAVYLDKPVGNTVHFMNSSIDQGPILTTESLSFSKSDSYCDVRSKVFQSGINLMSKMVSKFLSSDSPNVYSQDPSQGNYFNVIDEIKFSKVKEMLSRGEYRYQTD